MTDVTTEIGDLATDAVALPALERLANRELSWLDFNERVLALAEDPALPLLERVKFVAIFGSNLDEFYQVRVASLRKQEVAAPTLLSPDGLDATTQLRLIGERVAALFAAARALLHPRAQATPGASRHPGPPLAAPVGR